MKKNPELKLSLLDVGKPLGSATFILQALLEVPMKLSNSSYYFYEGKIKKMSKVTQRYIDQQST